MTKREVWGAVIAAFFASMLGGMGSLWAFSRDVATKEEAKEISVYVVNSQTSQVLSRLAALEAKVDILLSRERNGRGN